MIVLILSLSGCNQDNKEIVKNGIYVMVQEDTQEALLPRIIISHDEIVFSYDLLSSYMPYGTYLLEDDLLTMNTDDNRYEYVFQIDGDKLIFLENESSSLQLTDDRFGAKVTDKAIFRLKKD